MCCTTGCVITEEKGKKRKDKNKRIIKKEVCKWVTPEAGKIKQTQRSGKGEKRVTPPKGSQLTAFQAPGTRRARGVQCNNRRNTLIRLSLGAQNKSDCTGHGSHTDPGKAGGKF